MAYISSYSISPLLLPSDRPEVNLPPRMGLGLALGPGYEVGESSAAAAARPAGGFRADYGFIATMDRQVRRDPERYVGYGITDSWEEIVETLQGAPVSMLQSWLHTERCLSHWLMETRLGCREEAWGRAYDASDLAHGGVISLRTSVQCADAEIAELQSAGTEGAEANRRSIPLQGLVPHARATPHPLQVDSYSGIGDDIAGLVTALLGQQGPTGGHLHHGAAEEAGERVSGDLNALLACAPYQNGDCLSNKATALQKNQIQFCYLYSVSRCSNIVLEAELLDIKGVGTNVVKYKPTFSRRQHLLCVRMFPEEADKIERYVGGLPRMIHAKHCGFQSKRPWQEAIDNCLRIDGQENVQEKGFPIFLAHVIQKRLKDKWKMKRLEVVPTVSRLSPPPPPRKVFLKTCRVFLASTSGVFKIFWYLVPHYSTATCRVAPSEVKELSEQLKGEARAQKASEDKLDVLEVKEALYA
ncbi:hypothetical protein Tco_0841986 [Tanacetum coccineum]|uniref:Uncharacterized protein n=1 Tax=Tanacetum coccineum TaxID=301880 RepID=A0ABQ5B3K6_9ASTR